MTDEEINMEEIPAGTLARQLEVSPRTVQHWLTTGELEGRQTFSGRWFIKIGKAREFIKKKGKDRGETEARFNAYLRERFQQEGAEC